MYGNFDEFDDDAGVGHTRVNFQIVGCLDEGTVSFSKEYSGTVPWTEIVKDIARALNLHGYIGVDEHLQVVGNSVEAGKLISEL